MENYGEIFKTYREARGLSLKDIAESGLSTSQLSRFEKGESDLTITKFIKALRKIKMPINEFMYATNNFKIDEINRLWVQIQTLFITKDIHGLQKLLSEQQEIEREVKIFQQLNTTIIKIYLSDLTKEKLYTQKDIDYIVDYLFGVDYWGEYELLIFSNLLFALNHEMSMMLLKEMNRRTDFYKEIPSNRRIIASMNLNAFIMCIERNKWLDAHYFEKQLEMTFFKETEIYERYYFYFAKQMLRYKKDGEDNAIIEMKKIIAGLKMVDCHNIASSFEEELAKMLGSDS
ncbi:helix-turn-helix domain-containing protein [Enterococcus cecorum]|uniref:Helix-turn-helix domain-containing protein n=4 Tax=Enterococcus cecorum TaxID=44008 RepID=A0AAW9JIG5_9ENTE|nr:Rgg/GadR/MutR family transcriptional regulator [Enterococcus cecorum]MDZ5504293.1 helix-turn-helix domain-containing protein [Enterococcus cecorum]MDZ5531673.1 helix-turn-helix domain-containing protein [Enterococcus cecorum]MDZ5545226.1 helix-turn-helix domain-containing protein [Enterococcus cecorum]MDZ5549661.1 helix-turn-helix domain-containing protein [Enterococcus cecorum]MDZ5552023.1 helix-turn-helix domain-containing protein [Enterococcus cecorum]